MMLMTEEEELELERQAEEARQKRPGSTNELTPADIDILPVSNPSKDEIDFEGDVTEGNPWRPSELLKGIPNLPKGGIKLIKRLGNGAFGIVYQGIYQGRFVAVKELNIQHAQKQLPLSVADIQDTFEWEILGQQGLNHPDIVQLYGLYQTQDKQGHSRQGMVLEFCERGDLQGVVKKLFEQGKRLSLARIWQLAFDMAEGLAYLHAQGRIHRDLKTENILLDRYGRAKLGDLGVAQIDTLLVKRKETKAVEQGLRDYIWKSPEEFLDKPSSAASDIYAYALILWQLLTGKAPYIGFDDQRSLYETMVIQGFREPIPDYCPTEFGDLIASCWDPNPENRPNARAIIQALEAMAEKFHLQDHPEEASLKSLVLHSDLLAAEYRAKFQEYIPPYVTTYSVEEDFDEFWQSREKPIIQETENEKDEKESKENEETLRIGVNPAQAQFAPQSLEQSLKQFLASPNPVFALFGDGGLGKTLTVHHLAHDLLEGRYKAETGVDNQGDHWTPVFLRQGMTTWSHAALNNGIQKALAHPAYNLAGKEAVLKQAKILFIVEGYDELQLDAVPQNLPEQLRLQEWPNAKLLVTSRRFVIPSHEEVARLGLNVQLETRYMLSFNMEQLLDYLQKQLVWDTTTRQKYTKLIEAAPSLRAILRNPFVAYLFVQSFSITSQKDFKTLSRSDIYKNFIEHWLKNKANLLPTDVQKELEGDLKNLIESFHQFAEGFAFQGYAQSKLMFNASELPFQPWLQLKALIQASAKAQFLKREQGTKRTLLSEQNYVQILEQRLDQFLLFCPLKEREHQLGFMHKSFFEYFVAQHLIKAMDVVKLQGPALLQLLLSKRNLLSEPGVIAFLVDELFRSAPTNEGRKQVLLQQILASQKHPEHAQSASNAMTLLVRLRFPFSGMDLDDIQVPNSDWIQGVFHGTSMKRINASGVIATNTYLQDSCMDGSIMTGFKVGERAPLKGHAMPIQCMAYDATHNLIATGSGALNRDCGIRIWDVETGALVQSLPGHQDTILGLAFIPNATSPTLVSISKDKTLRRWNVITGEFQAFILSAIPQQAMSLSPDGELLAFAHEEIEAKRASEASFISLYSLKTNNIQQSFEAHARNISALAFVPNKNISNKNKNIVANYKLASSGEDNTLKLWSLEKSPATAVHSAFSPTLLWTQNTPASPKLTFSADNQKILSCTPHGAIAFLLNNGMLWQILKDPSLQAKTFSLACSSQFTAIGDGENIQVFDKTGVPRRFLSGHSGNIIDLTFTPERENHPPLLLSASHDRTVRLWESQGFFEAAHFPQHTGPLTGITLTPDERSLITASLDGSVRFWEASTAHLQRALKLSNIGITAVHLDKNGEYLLAGDEQGWIYVYSLKTENLSKFKAHASAITNLNTYINAAKQQVISSSEDKVLKLSDLSTKQTLKIFALQGWPPALIQRSFFSLDGQRLYTADRDGFARIWDINEGIFRNSIGEQLQTSTILLSLNGERLLIATKNSFVIKDWSLNSKKCIHCYEGHKAPVLYMNWDGTGEYLISGSEDNIIHIWNKDNPKPLLTLTMTAPIKALYLSSDASAFYVIQEDDLSLYGFRIQKEIDKQWQAMLQFQIGGRLNVQGVSANHLYQFPAHLKMLFKAQKANGGSLIASAYSGTRWQSAVSYVLDEKGYTPLMQAIQAQDDPTFKNLIQAKVDINQANFDDFTPLQFAAFQGLDGFCSLLIEGGAAINQADNDGRTPLFMAAQKGHYNVVALFCDKGANLNQTHKEGTTAVFIAAQFGHENVVAMLCDKGADPNQADNKGLTPLYIAAFEGHEQVVSKLCEKGADPNLANTEGETPLFVAAQFGRESMVALLLTKGAQPNQTDKNGATPIFIAAQEGYEAVIKQLCDKGGWPNQARNDGYAPLYAAAQGGHEGAVAILCGKGADPNQGNKNGYVPLYAAARKGYEPVVALLCEMKADPNQAANDGVTPLYVAAQNDHYGVVALLCDKGANLNQAQNNGATSLCIAAFQGHERVMVLLYDRGADPNQARINGISPLHTAVEKGHEGIVKLLLSNMRVDPNQATTDGITPLCIASDKGHTGIVKLLLEANASLEVKKGWGNALHYACDSATPNFELIELLLTHKADLNQPNANGETALELCEAHGDAVLTQYLRQRVSAGSIKAEQEGKAKNKI